MDYYFIVIATIISGTLMKGCARLRSQHNGWNEIFRLLLEREFGVVQVLLLHIVMMLLCQTSVDH